MESWTYKYSNVNKLKYAQTVNLSILIFKMSQSQYLIRKVTAKYLTHRVIAKIKWKSACEMPAKGSAPDSSELSEYRCYSWASLRPACEPGTKPQSRNTWEGQQGSWEGTSQWTSLLANTSGNQEQR